MGDFVTFSETVPFLVSDNNHLHGEGIPTWRLSGLYTCSPGCTVLDGAFRELGEKETSDVKQKTQEIHDVADSIGYYCESPRDQNIWVRPRTDAWIAMACSKFSEKEWYENFHVSKGTVLYIVHEVDMMLHTLIRNCRKHFPHFKEWFRRFTTWHPLQNVVSWLICLECSYPLSAFV